VRIALFITCVDDTLVPDAGEATVRVLERLGHRVEFPEEQTSCGQMPGHGVLAQQSARPVRWTARWTS
jgi:Fe-S oxidoreductase